MAENFDELPEWRRWAEMQDPIGERFVPQDGKLVIDRRPAASDREAAAHADVQRQHQVTLEAARRLHALVVRRGNALTMVWADLQPTVERYLVAADRETAALPDVLPDLYQNSVGLGSLFDQDEALRQQPEEGESPLPVDVRRVLLETVTAAALLSRAFPSNLKRDAELAAFNRARDLAAAREVVKVARENERLTPDDSALLEQMETAAARQGPQGEKSAGRITMTAGNLIVVGVSAAVMGGLTFVSAPVGAAIALPAAAWVNRSPLWRGFGDFVAQLGAPAVRLADRMAADARAAILGFYRWLDADAELRGGAPSVDDVPPADFDLDRVVDMILDGHAPPEAWRPFVIDLDLSPDLLSGVSLRTRKPRVEELNERLGSLRNLMPLQGLTSLQTLDVSHTDVTDLTPLKGLRALRSLNIDGTAVANSRPLADLTSLQNLSLRGTKVIHLKALRAISALLHLDLSHTSVANLTALEALSVLQTLNLSYTNVADVTPLKGLAALQTLDLSHTTVANLTPLESLLGLQDLAASHTRVADLAPLSGHRGLHTLDITGTRVTSLAPLKRLSSLRDLDISGTRVKDLTPIQGLSALRSLDLTDTAVADLDPLEGLTSLKKLDLSGTKIKHLSFVAKLKELQLLIVDFQFRAAAHGLLRPGLMIDLSDARTRRHSLGRGTKIPLRLRPVPG